jgi:oligopeptide/dipeptide ABC transporter ATP-binding protein
MYAGQIVEVGPTREVIANPLHPYTQGLIGSIPRLSDLDRPLRPIDGQVPELVDLPPQCRFYSRCTKREARCLAPVSMREIGPERAARCVLVDHRTEELIA